MKHVQYVKRKRKRALVQLLAFLLFSKASTIQAGAITVVDAITKNHQLVRYCEQEKILFIHEAKIRFTVSMFKNFGVS
jgi:hypothetical protein